MSLRASVFIAVSLDGFIAREDGGLDWLDAANATVPEGEDGGLDWLDAANATVPEGEDCGYQAFMDSIDVLIMGRKTYEKVLSFGQWPYASKRVIILSRHIIEIPDELIQTVSHSSESPKELYERLSKEGAKRLYIDGGLTIQRFLAEGLINDLIITVIPVILGSGIPLFGNLIKDIPLKHIATKTYDFGFVQLSYEVLNA